jgi:hypothetical protein
MEKARYADFAEWEPAASAISRYVYLPGNSELYPGYNPKAASILQFQSRIDYLEWLKPNHCLTMLQPPFVCYEFERVR